MKENEWGKRRRAEGRRSGAAAAAASRCSPNGGDGDGGHRVQSAPNDVGDGWRAVDVGNWECDVVRKVQKRREIGQGMEEADRDDVEGC
jgi:hypothetical protein